MWNKNRTTFKEKIDMYDMIIANLLAGKAIIEPTKKLSSTDISIGFSTIASETSICKYYMIKEFPDYVQTDLYDQIRETCLRRGVKIDFYTYVTPYRINWGSEEMKSRMKIWKNYANTQSTSDSVFDYRDTRSVDIAKERIMTSTQYLNKAELDYRRTTCKAMFIVKITAVRNEVGIIGLSSSTRALVDMCKASDIKIKELRVNLIDWIRAINPFSMRASREVGEKLSRKIVTDDVLAKFSGYKQGRVGKDGILIGMDVTTLGPVTKKIKADPDAAENWLICAETGGGKSFIVKSMLTYLLASGFVVTVMDYEGDEYSNLAYYLAASDPSFVKIISMGRGSTVYYDPMEIPELTGDKEVDIDLKESAMGYTLALFRLIVGGIDGSLNQWEERIISTAIKRVYEANNVTDSMNTWYRSRGLCVRMVYEAIKEMEKTKEYIDLDNDNIKHKTVLRILDGISIYFEDGETKSGTFKNPMSANELYKSKFIIFSFGMKGATASQIDPVVLALKQLSVANLSIQISNHCKYVKKCFNVKVWEEFQRWGQAKGSSEIIVNAMTGGRKRGDVNFIITNNLSEVLDETNMVSAALRDNFQNYLIGKVTTVGTRNKFCETFALEDILEDLSEIAAATSTENNAKNDKVLGKYSYAFCAVLDTGKKAVVRSRLPKEIEKSSLYKTGVSIAKE